MQPCSPAFLQPRGPTVSAALQPCSPTALLTCGSAAPACLQGGHHNSIPLLVSSGSFGAALGLVRPQRGYGGKVWNYDAWFERGAHHNSIMFSMALAPPGQDSPDLATPLKPTLFLYSCLYTLASQWPWRLQGHVPFIWPPYASTNCMFQPKWISRNERGAGRGEIGWSKKMLSLVEGLSVVEGSRAVG